MKASCPVLQPQGPRTPTVDAYDLSSTDAKFVDIEEGRQRPRAASECAERRHRRAWKVQWCADLDVVDGHDLARRRTEVVADHRPHKPDDEVTDWQYQWQALASGSPALTHCRDIGLPGAYRGPITRPQREAASDAPTLALPHVPTHGN